MAAMNPKAVNSGRGSHPDLDDDGALRADALADPAEREFARMRQDEGAWGNFMARVAANQSLEPRSVQEWVQGRTYGTGNSAREGYREYLETVDYARQDVAASSGKTVFVDDAWIRASSDAEYDACFDANGKPREHVYYHPNRGVPLDGAMDPWTARELHQSRPRKEQP